MSLFALITAVAFGVLLVLILKPGSKSIQLFLSFSGAYLLSITVLHLIPEVFEGGSKQIGVYILLGILIQTILEYFSKGAEHGHIHIHGNATRLPWLLFLSLSLHAFFEGVPIASAESNLILWAVVVHKIPISIVLFIFLLNSNIPKKTTYVYMLLFALMSPLGYLLSSQSTFLNNYHTEITAVIIGVFLHIATAILFESTQNHEFNSKKFIIVLLGFVVAFLSTQLMIAH